MNFLLRNSLTVSLRTMLLMTALAVILVTGKQADADSLVVVIHPQNVVSLTAQDIYRLYFGKVSSFPDGSTAVPVIRYNDKDQLRAFSVNVLGRSTRQLRSYWARQLFTGKGKPPLEVESVEKMKALVASNPNYIGYLWLPDLDGSVRAVFEVPVK